MQPYTAQDIVGDGAAHTLASLLGITACRWFQVNGVSIASTAIPARVGDSSISLDVASPLTLGRGFPAGPGGGQFAPPVALGNEVYDLTKWYVRAAVGDTYSAGAVV